MAEAEETGAASAAETGIATRIGGEAKEDATTNADSPLAIRTRPGIRSATARRRRR
jgi:hypothetical protein